MKLKHFQKPELPYWPPHPRKLLQKEFRHVWLLLYWAAFGLLFMYVERLSPVTYYTPIYSPLDDLIPFCEWFFLPYMYWFVYLIGAVVYAILYDVREFRRMMYFVMVTYSITMVTYLVWPTCQELRPAAFPRDNVLTRIIGHFYNFDTNTNVCPSIHVIGSVAAMLMGLHAKQFRSTGWRIYFIVACLLIAVSTVFMKQHSIVDVVAAVPVCLIGWLVAYVPGYVREKAKQKQEVAA